MKSVRFSRWTNDASYLEVVNRFHGNFAVVFFYTSPERNAWFDSFFPPLFRWKGIMVIIIERRREGMKVTRKIRGNYFGRKDREDRKVSTREELL